MKLDCIAFVNAQGKTLLTREALTSFSRIKAEVAALEKTHEVRVYALRSFVDKDGKEVMVEILTPDALACTGNTARVEYWRPAYRPNFPQFKKGQRIAKQDFFLAGILITPAHDAAAEAYAYTESPFYRWNPTMEAGKSPASCVGDVFVVSSALTKGPVAYGVADIGFTEVIFHD